MNALSKATVLLVGNGLESAAGIETMITERAPYRVVGADAGDIATDAGPKTPDAVILDVDTIDDAEMTILNTLRAKYRDVPIIVASVDLDDAQMRRLFKSQVHDWLRKPLNRETLLASLNSAVRLTATQGNRVHAVVSAVGGAGATSVAVSMADLVQTSLRKSGQKVALFDLDFSTGDCSYVLNLINEHSLSGAIAQPDRIDAEFLDLIQKPHPGGFSVFSFKRPELNADVDGYELVLRMLDAVNMQYHQTILDIPYYETAWKNDVLGAVNTATVVTQLSLPAIKHAIDVVERIKTQRGDDFPVRVVFNRHRDRLFNKRFKTSTLKDLFGTTPFSFLAEDTATFEESVDRGVLPSEVQAGSKFLKGLRGYINETTLVDAA